MIRLFPQPARFALLIAILVCIAGPRATADTTPVRHVEGTLHGFLELRAPDGRIVASGDSTTVVDGDRVTAHTIFHFKDGSLDDETTVFSQHHDFRLISDRHIQKGPAFPHPMDVSIDAGSGQVTVHYQKDGKEQVDTSHMDLPSDLVNGMVPVVVENMRPGEASTTVAMLVATPKPRVVKLVLTRLDDDSFALGGATRKAIHYQIKIELGGLAGILAPLFGKQPPDIEIWTVGGDAPVFVKEQGPLYPQGPMMTIQLASPVWGKQTSSGD